MQVYLVGGAVRDKLLGLTPQDRDWVVVGATPEQMLELGYKPVGKDFPVFLHPETREEYALARTERKTAPGYHGFAFHAAPDVTLEEDLKRRDLTINAMAEDSEGNIIDPFNGREDLEQGRLRHVASAFAEDPVRILRLARYAARYAKWGFRVAHGTHALMKKMVASGEVDALVAERVWQETERALGEETPSRFFEVLRNCGALARIFPELDQLFGVPQPRHHHPEEDTGLHTMLVLEQSARLSPDTRVRFAALVHDLGKGTTPEEEWPKHIAHEHRGVALVEQLCERLRVPRDYRELALIVTQHHGVYHRAEELRPSTLLELLEKTDAFRRPERLEQFLLACEADSRGRPGFETQHFAQPGIIRQSYHAAREVDPGELVKQGFSGKQVGEELHRRRIAAIAAARDTVPSDE
ncbi:MAG: multifunctional CCA addition/repair protein [Gammaproteobacteria bacterium]|nr:multifunctional CCA addition/repair protein [Gammaproteobacteria bacterium]MCW8973987.1 multifunctional CCA addition/repair protein [Gammaproteobacteria bacterium]MCW8993843.1 multifunctional CCA addition/repair protein [Gammaproteobacteria bacterium]